MVCRVESRRAWSKAAALTALIAGLPCIPCVAAVVVVANRTGAPVSFDALVDDQRPRSVTLAPGDSRPFVGHKGVRIRVMENGFPRSTSLDADCAYYVGVDPTSGQPSLQKIGLNETRSRPWSPPGPPPVDLPGAAVITVKILVDDDEPRPRNVWEPLIRRRIADASAVLEAHAGVRLQVIAVDTWDSDDKQTDFFESLAEFEREVSPRPAQVAIGFSSQYAIAHGRIHLGGTRGPLHAHVLLKERANNVLETERLELLVHELGHFLGASHSPEPTSVMRPVLSGALQRVAGAHVQFDPVNTLLIAMMGEEMRERRVQTLADVSADARARMGEIYAALAPTLPDDPATGQYLQVLAAAGAMPVIEDARRVMGQIARVAKLEHKKGRDAAGAPELPLPVNGSEPPNVAGLGAAVPVAAESGGDRLLELYVRQAALAAKQARRDTGSRGLLLALGVAMDDADVLRRLPGTGDIVAQIETSPQRLERLAAIGKPTLRGSQALARDFFVSAYMAALVGSEPARSADLARQLIEGIDPRGLPFADLAASRAGIAFAGAVLTGRLTLDDVSQRFTVEAVLPPLDRLRADVGFKEFLGGPGESDARLGTQLVRLETHLSGLPIYQTRAPAPP